MKYNVYSPVTPQIYEALIHAAKLVGLGWETVVRISYEAGIPASQARTMGPKDLHPDGIDYNPKNTIRKYRRNIPKSLRNHLQSLPQDCRWYAPSLAALSTRDFYNSWRKVRDTSGHHVQLVLLHQNYVQSHETAIIFEHTHQRLQELALKYLDESALEKLLRLEKEWGVLGPTSTIRTRHRSRSEILAAHERRKGGAK